MEQAPEITWKVSRWEDLDLDTFHAIAILRIKVFVVEQNCPYEELDGRDPQCVHLTGHNPKGEVVATLRIVPPGIAYPEPAIGRVVIDPAYRGTGLGHRLMLKGMEVLQEEFGPTDVRLSAQRHLEKYYAANGFEATGKYYMEDGIPHVDMVYRGK